MNLKVVCLIIGITILTILIIVKCIQSVKENIYKHKNIAYFTMIIFNIILVLGLGIILVLNKREGILFLLSNFYINYILVSFISFLLAYMTCSKIAISKKLKYDKDYVIILGCGIKNDGRPSLLLRRRIDKAIEFSKKQFDENKKKITFIASGGQGVDEVIPEGVAIKNYMMTKSIPEEQIIVEDKSTSTFENIKFSREKIKNVEKNKIIISTTKYHLLRSGIIANKDGLYTEGIGGKSKWYALPSAILRELVAIIYDCKILYCLTFLETFILGLSSLLILI